MRGLVFNVQRFSTEDGPGIRTTVFLKGCPMRCPWCQNPEGMSPRPVLTWAKESCLGDRACVAACPERALVALPERIGVDRDRCQACGACAEACPAGALELVGLAREPAELVEELCRDRPFYASSGGGVTLSGGEPTSQLPFLLEVLDRCGAAGLHRAVDTCGAVGAAELAEVLPRVELVLLDLKQMDEALHLEQTGIRLERVLAAARQIARAGVRAWIRTPVIPGYTDTEQNVRAIARFIRAELPSVERLDLLGFSRLCLAKYRQLDLELAAPAQVPLVPRAHLERLRAVALEEGLANVVWSGMTAE